MKIFESFILCCSVHVAAVGFPACALWLVDEHTASCQPSIITNCISNREGTAKTAPGKMQKHRKSVQSTLESELSCNLKQHLQKRANLDQLIYNSNCNLKLITGNLK